MEPPQISAADIEHLRAICDQATGPPWQVYAEQIPSAGGPTALADLLANTDAQAGAVFLLIDADGKCPALTGCGPKSANNALFIAVARTELPRLLDAFAAADRRLRELEAERDAYVRALDHSMRLLQHGLAPDDRLAERALPIAPPLPPPRASEDAAGSTEPGGLR